MGQPAAKQGDKVMASDTHILLVPSPGGSVPIPTPHPFSGTLAGGLSQTVKIEGKAAAVVGSTATNSPSHIPANPAAQFQKPPANKGTVQVGSPTVRINGKAAARHGDTVMTCNDPADQPVGKIISTGTVNIG
jgi:uncharacterized Zn-binding protein involved in type VI secretion